MKMELKDVGKTYSNGKVALEDVSITIETPCFIGMLGKNGAGKSTLIKLLTANLLHSKGKVLFNGEDLKKSEKNLKRRLGYLPQEFGLYEELTVYQFLDYIAALRGMMKAKEEINKLIDEVGLEEKRKSRIHSLSGGQKQRVGIAAALLGNPEIIILDEPTVGLDPEERVRFRNLFAKLAKDKIVILSTHIVEDVQSVCNDIMILSQGKIIFNNKIEKLVTNGESLEDAYMRLIKEA